MTTTERNELILHLVCLMTDLPGRLHYLLPRNDPGPVLDITMDQKDNRYGPLTTPPSRVTVTITFDELGECMTRGWGYPQHLIRTRWAKALAEKRADS